MPGSHPPYLLGHQHLLRHHHIHTIHTIHTLHTLHTPTTLPLVVQTKRQHRPRRVQHDRVRPARSDLPDAVLQRDVRRNGRVSYDVFAFAFLLADKYHLDVKEIVLDKIKANGEKYPVEKAKGTAKKYNEL